VTGLLFQTNWAGRYRRSSAGSPTSWNCKSLSLARGGCGPGATARAASHCLRASGLLCSALSANQLTGTIGSWIGSISKLTFL
jgi:hypothetical protein